tara:strand:- start:7273 stop:7509 length:237 start_codon:yes stop_codon:yes gene_type:complete
MEDLEMVIVSITEWDGTRVLGAFDNEEVARLCLEKSKIKCDSNITFDIIESNKISIAHKVGIDVNKPLTRKHVYEDSA